MNNNSKIVLNYLHSEYQKSGNSFFNESDIVDNTHLNDCDYENAINELKTLGYIQKWIIGIKLEVD